MIEPSEMNIRPQKPIERRRSREPLASAGALAVVVTAAAGHWMPVHSTSAACAACRVGAGPRSSYSWPFPRAYLLNRAPSVCSQKLPGRHRMTEEYVNRRGDGMGAGALLPQPPGMASDAVVEVGRPRWPNGLDHGENRDNVVLVAGVADREAKSRPWDWKACRAALADGLDEPRPRAGGCARHFDGAAWLVAGWATRRRPG